MDIKQKDIVLFEHQSWLQILGDHARFIYTALSPKETFFIRQANQFIIVFDNLLDYSRKRISDEDISKLNVEAYSATMNFRDLKLTIIHKMIMDKLDIQLPPTFVNHMVNEIEEYLSILNDFLKGNLPDNRDIDLHLLWLLDGVGHASAIANDLDMTQKELIKESKKYSKMFMDLYLRTIEYNGYTRTGVYDFPALSKHNTEVDEIMSCFKEFLQELKVSIIEKKVLGTLAPLMLDHMFREECYYLTKLSMVSDTNTPQCDPAKPRSL